METAPNFLIYKQNTLSKVSQSPKQACFIFVAFIPTNLNFPRYDTITLSSLVWSSCCQPVFWPLHPFRKLLSRNLASFLISDGVSLSWNGDLEAAFKPCKKHSECNTYSSSFLLPPNLIQRDIDLFMLDILKIQTKRFAPKFNMSTVKMWNSLQYGAFLERFNLDALKGHVIQYKIF